MNGPASTDGKRRPLQRVSAYGVLALLTLPGMGFVTGSAIAQVPTVDVSVTTPHVANGINESTVTVTVTDILGAPVPNADIALEISGLHALVSQVGHLNRHVIAPHAGSGRYRSLFASPDLGPVNVVAQDRGSSSSDFAFVDFRAAAVVPLALGAAPAQDPTENCKRFFDKLDEEFLATVLQGRLAEAERQGNNAERDRLRQRLQDIAGITPATRTAIALEIAIARREPQATIDKLRQDLTAQENNARASFVRISDAQEAILKEFFGNPIDFNRFQTCVESFTNFQLADNFEQAVIRIRQARALFDQIFELDRRIRDTPPGADRDRLIAQLRALSEQFLRDFRRIAVRAPDGTQENIRWAKFANIAIRLNINPDLWRNMKPILAKGSAITVEVLRKKDPAQPGVPSGRLTPERVAQIRAMFDPLRPRDGDTPQQRDRKIALVEERLIELLKTIKVDRATVAQLPGLDGTAAFLGRVENASCTEGDAEALDLNTTSALALNLDGDGPFGFGADDSGASYLITGSTAGSEVSLTMSGFGLNPATGSGIATLTGTIAGDTISGEWNGVASSTPGRPNNICTWAGSFVIAPRQRCDMNGDGQVDRNDIARLFGARNVPATTGDPRDVDEDALITVNDARVCTLECTNPQCADLALAVGTSSRISTGFATVATTCTVTPAATARCELDNDAGGGGVNVTCRARQVAGVTIRFSDQNAAVKSAAHAVSCN